jgi:hypothetical protein
MNELNETAPAAKAWGFMVDCETVGLGENAGVLQLAFVPFLIEDPLAQYPGQTIHLALQPQLDMGRAIECQTLKFWLDQPPMAQTPLLNALASTGDSESIRESLEALAIWLRSWIANAESIELWSKGAGFDVRILKNLFAQFAIEWPFHYRADRDLRTLMALAEMDSSTLTRTSTEPAHNALGDCRFQIRQYSYAMGLVIP